MGAAELLAAIAAEGAAIGQQRARPMGDALASFPEKGRYAAFREPRNRLKRARSIGGGLSGPRKGIEPPTTQYECLPLFE
jgi:hypothetical protein